MKLYVADAPLTVDQDGERRIIPPKSVIDPAIIEQWPEKGLWALVDVGRVKVYDLDEIDRVVAEYEDRFGDNKPAKKSTARAA